jgi:hypothetical protein
MSRALKVWAAGVVALGFLGATQVKADRTLAEKTSAVAFRAASATPVKGFEPMTLEDGRTIHVAPRATFAGDEVVTALFTSERNLHLSLTSDAVERLNRARTSQLAVFMDGKLATTIGVEAVNSDGGVSLTDVSDKARARLAGALGAGSAYGPVMRVVPQQKLARPGDIVTVDVFLEGATGVRTFQVAMDAIGGRTGKLIRQPGHIDHERSDFIHAGLSTLPAVDDVGGRFGAATIDGSTAEAATPKYLGSFDYQVSDDASGTFIVKVRMGEDAFLLTEDGTYMPLSAINATIRVDGDTRSTR